MSTQDRTGRVIPFPDSQAHSVRVPGPLALADEVRMVPVTRTQVERIEQLAIALSRIGVADNSALLMAIAAQWKVAS